MPTYPGDPRFIRLRHPASAIVSALLPQTGEAVGWFHLATGQRSLAVLSRTHDFSAAVTGEGSFERATCAQNRAQRRKGPNRGTNCALRRPVERRPPCSWTGVSLLEDQAGGFAHRPLGRLFARAVPAAGYATGTPTGCEIRMWLPNGSRNPKSMP